MGEVQLDSEVNEERSNSSKLHSKRPKIRILTDEEVRRSREAGVRVSSWQSTWEDEASELGAGVDVCQMKFRTIMAVESAAKKGDSNNQQGLTNQQDLDYQEDLNDLKVFHGKPSLQWL